MNDFLSEIQCDELNDHAITVQDQEEYLNWLDSLENSEPPVPDEGTDGELRWVGRVFLPF